MRSLKNRKFLKQLEARGFALVATITIMSLIVMVSLAMVSLAMVNSRSDSATFYRDMARANARVALSEAISKLQFYMGPDQRVCAEYSIFENSDDPQTGLKDETNYLPNRHWLGVYKTTYTDSDGADWPLIGRKSSDPNDASPYKYKSSYSDLRETISGLSDYKWTEEQRLGYLVSGDQFVSPSTVLDPSNGESVELLGEATLYGESKKVSAVREFQRRRVFVPLQSIIENSLSSPGISGKYGFWVTNNNLKANITAFSQTDQNAALSPEIVVTGNPAAAKNYSSKRELSNFKLDFESSFDSVISPKTLELFENTNGGIDENVLKSIKNGFHDFTTSSYGMYVNVRDGGFMRDLTPLMFGDRRREFRSLKFEHPYWSSSASDSYEPDFHSNSPIIPGADRAVLGPSFDALRSWGILRYIESNSSGVYEADTNFYENNSNDTVLSSIETKWKRPDTGWSGHGISVPGTSDGYGLNGSSWAAFGPKFVPVMTESRYHFFLSQQGEGGQEPEDSNLRFHMVPRVCLWNPFSVDMVVPKMLVCMYNPLYKPSSDTQGTFKILLSEDEKLRLIKEHGTEYPAGGEPIYNSAKEIDSAEKKKAALHAGSWKDEDPGSKGAEVKYALVPGGVRNNDGNKDDRDLPGAVPRARYLLFVLEPTKLKAGQNAVFSPKGRSSTGKTLESKTPNYSVQYDPNDAYNNVLSAEVPENRHSFYHDYGCENVWLKLKLGSDDADGDPQYGNITYGRNFFRNINLSKSESWEFDRNLTGNWSHMLKFILPSAPSKIVLEDIMREDGVDADDFPTLQTMVFGQAGTDSGYLSWRGSSMGRNTEPILTFKDSGFPSDSCVRTFQVGARISMLDEKNHEGQSESPPRRVQGDRLNPNSLVFNYPLVASGNVRPHIVCRTAASPAVDSQFGAGGIGSWIHTFYPSNPGSSDDLSQLSQLNDSGNYEKNPFAFNSLAPSASRAIMFDLPDPTFGSLSLANLRHASLSPYSWHPTYIIGSSICDIHGTADSTAKPIFEKSVPLDPSRYYLSLFDYLIGSEQQGVAENGGTLPNDFPLEWGGRSRRVNNSSLLQIGKFPTSKVVQGEVLTSKDENLIYDIAFEVNENLWDQFFLSGVRFRGSSKTSVDWNKERVSDNPNVKFNPLTGELEDEVILETKEKLDSHFWLNGYLMKNALSFNVNSTSVNAWVSYLSGLRGNSQLLQNGNLENPGQSNTVFSRVSMPESVNETKDVDIGLNAFATARSLSEKEIYKLAVCIVNEVKKRGPFLSIADFVNRRLTKESDPASLNGALESAIIESKINEKLENSLGKTLDVKFHPKNKNGLNNFPGKSMPVKSDEGSYMPPKDRMVNSKIWGTPAHLNQGDLLASIAPLLSVRGETFTIRAYGDARKNGVVMATAYCEAVVVRSPKYLAGVSGLQKNVDDTKDRHTEPVFRKRLYDGTLTRTDFKDEINKIYGRKFNTISFRWLDENEI